MTDHSAPAPLSDVRSAVAVPMEGTAVFVTMRRGARGPWSIVADVPNDERELAGPPPGALVLAGIGSCTIVTVAGVASRGGPPLHDMRVDFEVTGRDGGGFEVRQHTTLGAELADADFGRLRRAAAHCPVGKIFTKRAIEIEDQVHLDGVHDRTPETRSTPNAPALSVFLPGRVSARWLAGTREWRVEGGERVLAEEGEVAVHIDAARASSGLQRWGLLGGHTSAGWAPRPSSYAMAGLASSTVMTLRALATELHLEASTIRVEVRALSQAPAGGKRASQDAAAIGQVASVRWLRALTARATSDRASVDVITRAMGLDPIYGYCARGDLLASDQVDAVAPLAAVPGTVIA